MNTKPVRVYTAALAASAAAIALFVTGCSSNSSTSPASSAAPAAPAAAGGGSAPSAAASAPSGASAASVDGKPLTATFDTTCAKEGGTLALTLADINNSTYGHLAVTATITGGNTVAAVGIAGSKGGSTGLPYAVGFGNGMPGGSATVAQNGTNYHVTGEGVGAPDPSNFAAGPKTSKFDITFACSTVVGG